MGANIEVNTKLLILYHASENTPLTRIHPSPSLEIKHHILYELTHEIP